MWQAGKPSSLQCLYGCVPCTNVGSLCLSLQAYWPQNKIIDHTQPQSSMDRNLQCLHTFYVQMPKSLHFSCRFNIYYRTSLPPHVVSILKHRDTRIIHELHLKMAIPIIFSYYKFTYATNLLRHLARPFRDNSLLAYFLVLRVDLNADYYTIGARIDTRWNHVQP